MRKALGYHYRDQAGRGGDSRSESSSATTNTDKRVAVDSGVGLSGDNSSVVITDSGIVSRALDSVDTSSAMQADTFDKLLNVSERLIGSTQKSVSDAYSKATTDAKGSLDNKTIVILGVTAAAALAYAQTRGKK